jgi:ketosteroid isomerase-like protein
MAVPISGPIRAAQMFAAAINHQNVGQLVELMTEDHVFIDALGSRVQGRAAMRQGWEAYFRMVPDYTITIHATFVEGPVAVMLGTAQGTYSINGALVPENRWSTPAAWRCLVHGGLVAEWQVYADNEPLRQIMNRSEPT